MPRKRVAARTAQAWMERIASDPEAVSALAVARAHLDVGRSLVNLRRMRVIEVTGPLPAADELRELLHRSSQFYNPHNERCHLRIAEADAPPLDADERAVLVTERGEERRAGAERWWKHETGAVVEVREGVAWAMRFDLPAKQVAAAVESLALLRDRRTGLLCNPHAQDVGIAGTKVPLPWLAPTA
jgi:hypothetical protein